MPKSRTLFTVNGWGICCALILFALIANAGSAYAQGAPASSWPMLGGDPQHTGRSSAIGPATADIQWSFEAGGGQPAVVAGADGTIYLGTDGGQLLAINPNGSERWRFTIEGKNFCSYPAIATDGTVYIHSNADDARLFAINPDGTQKWIFTAADGLDTAPVVGGDGTIFVAGYNTLYAINPDGSQKWIFRRGWLACCPAVGLDGTVYWSSGSYEFSSLYAINPDGSEKWEFAADREILSSPAIGADGTVYLACVGGDVYAFDCDGATKWKFPMGGWNVGACPAIAPDGTIYMGSDSGHLYAINPNGSKKWDFLTDYEDRSTFAIDAAGTVYIGSNWAKFYARNPDGSIKWSMPPSYGYRTPPVMGADGTLYMCSGEDVLYAIGPGQTPVGPSISISKPSAQATRTGPVTYTVEYGNATSVDLSAADVTLNLTGSASATVAVSGDGNTSRTITLSDITGTGRISVTIAAGTASNAIGPAAGVTGGACDVDNAITGRGDWWMLNHDPQHTARSSFAGPSLPVVAWTVPTSTSYSSPTFDSLGNIIYGSSMFAPDGSVKWNRFYNGPSAIGTDGTAYLVTGMGGLQAISPNDCRWWFHDSVGCFYSAPAIAPDGTVYSGSRDGLYAFNPDGSQKWRCEIRNGVETSPAIGYDGTIYVGLDYGLMAINPDGTQKWMFPAENFGFIFSPSVGADGTIYVGCYLGKLYAINPNGTKKWEFQAVGQIDFSPALGADGTIYVTSGGGNLYAVDQNGLEKWRAAISGRFPAIGADGTIYIGSDLGYVYALDPNGVQKWEFATGCYGSVWSIAIGDDGRLYVAYSNGNLCAIGQDYGAPPLIAISEPTASTATSGPVSYTVVYSGAEQISLSAADIHLNKTGTAAGTISVTGSGNTRTVEISNITGNGVLGISVSAGAASNAAGSAPAAGPSSTFNVSNPAPSLTISAPSANAATTGPVTYLVTYSDSSSVTLTADDVQLNKYPTADGTVSVTGSGNTRTVTISNITGDGALGISIHAGTASNATGSAPAAGPSATFQVRNSPPKILIGPPSAYSTRTNQVSYSVSCNDNVPVSFKAANVTLNRTGSANGVVYVDGSCKGVTIMQITGEGTLGISISAGIASNIAGPSAATGPSQTFAVVKSAPSVKIGPPSVSRTAGGPVSYTITYSGAGDVNLRTADVTLIASGTAHGTVLLTGSGPTTRTVTISNIAGNGSLRISIPRGTAINVVGVAPAPSRSAAFEVDNTLPTVKIGSPSKTSTKSGPITYGITYSHAEAISLTAAGVHLVKTGTASGTLSVTGSGTTSRKVTISGITGDGSLGISIDAGTASNTAGLAPAAGPSAAFAVTNTPPGIGISAPSVSSTKYGPVSFVVTYTNATSVFLSSPRVHLTKTGTASGSISVSGSGTSARTVTISKTKGTGTLGISIDAGTASNAGGSAPSSGPSAAFTVGGTQ